MIEEEQTKVGRAYHQAMEPWLNLMATWNRQAQKAVNDTSTGDNGSKGLLGFWKMPAWAKADDLNRVLESTKVQTGAMKDMGEFFAKRSTAFQKFQDAWLDSWVQIFRKGYEVGVESIKDDTIHADDFIQTLDAATDRLEDALREFLKDTPFAELSSVPPAVRKSMESFVEEKKTATALWEEWISFQRKTAELAKAAAKEWMSAEGVKSKTPFSARAARQIGSEYGALLKKTANILDIPEEVKAHLQTLTDDGVDVTEKGLDAAESWIEMALQVQRSLYASTRNQFSFFNGYKLLTGEYGWKEWQNDYESFVRDTLQNANLSHHLSGCFAAGTELTQASGRFYRDIWRMPCPPTAEQKIEKPPEAKQKTAKKPTRENP